MLCVLVLYMSTKQHFILIIVVVKMRLKQMVKVLNLKEFLSPSATDEPHCFCGSGNMSLILMLHFNRYEVYIDVVHLVVYFRQSERI